MSEFRFYKLNTANEIQFAQIMEVENSTDSGYDENTMRIFFLTGGINDNFVCEKDGKIIAHITFNPNSKRRNGSVYMVNLIVCPQHRRQGIAQGLICEACKYYIDKKETKVMSLSVDKDNFKAINLYKKVGYEIVAPICEADEDEGQHIMVGNLESIKKTICEKVNYAEKQKEI